MDSGHILIVIANVATRYTFLCAIQINATLSHCICHSTPLKASPQLRTALSLLYPRVEAGTLQDGSIMHQHHIHPYPYITTCLILGVSFNLHLAYHFGYPPKVLKSGTLFEENDPDISGFTAIDISDTRALLYCFWKLAEDPDTGSVSLAPFSADEYVRIS
ncbi:hypothetical protein MMC31_002022 [Peltigera leucophlebia]|nr:hypothetical protein [Peltigera leucophlebia]